MPRREHWNERYRAASLLPNKSPVEFLVDNLNLLPKGKALDVAMGEGRNALFLAEQGFEVTGIDYSEVAVERANQQAQERGLTIKTVVADLTDYLLPKAEYDVIVNCYYLQRDLIPELHKALRMGGVIVFETYTTEHLQFQPDMNPAFLLKPGELLKLFPDLTTLVYREGVIYQPEAQRRNAVASLIARKAQQR